MYRRHIVSAIVCRPTLLLLLLRSPPWQESGVLRSVCLSVCVCFCLSEHISGLEPLDRSSRNFVCRFPVAVAWSSSGDVAIPGRSLMSMNALCCDVYSGTWSLYSSTQDLAAIHHWKFYSVSSRVCVAVQPASYILSLNDVMLYTT